MRVWLGLVLALAMAWVTIPAAAEKPQKPKAKPTYNQDKESKGTGRTVKPAPTRSSSEQELRKVEQSSAKTSASRKGDGGKAHSGAVLRAQKQERNPPIQFSSAGGSGGGSKGKTSNPYKGRLRHKGSHR